ncbi:MAG: extracellular solute-binding protein [Acholeplasmatales bacterium]|nr:MAG: extracellular solute-binding protein [Acholeplasmatales bacterium]
MKKFMIISVLIALTLSLTGCFWRRDRSENGASTETLTLTIWEDTKNIEMIMTITDEFARYYALTYPNAPRLRFDIVPHSEQSAIEDLVLDGPAGRGPDIVAFVHDTLGVAVGGNHLAPNMFAATIRAEHTEEAAHAASLNDVMYGFPITSESQILIYRPSKMSALQAENIETIIGTDAANARLVWDIYEGYYSFGLLNDAMLYGVDGETTTGPNFLNFATPQAIENILYMHTHFSGNTNLRIPGKISGTTDIEGLNQFLSQTVDAIIVAPYFWATAKEAFGADVAMTVLPQVNGQQMRPFSGYKLYGVSRYSKHPALAQELANFLVSDWAQALRFRDRSLLPTQTSLLEKMDQNTIVVNHWRNLDSLRMTIPEATLAEGRVFLASLETSILMPKIERFSAFWLAYANNMKALWEQGTLTQAQLIEYLNNMTRNM